MRLPNLGASNDSRQTIDSFGGYNHNLRISDSEFYDMENLTSDYAPVLGPRKPRGTKSVVSVTGDLGGMIEKQSLCYIKGRDFVMNDYAYEMGLSTDPEVVARRQMISMGAYVIILPDKKYINTASAQDYGDIEAVYSTADTVRVKIQPCRLDGSTYDIQYKGSTAPENPGNMEYWMDTSGEKPSLKQWSDSTKMWTSVATVYLKISIASSGIGMAFKQYDGVKISFPGFTPKADSPVENQIKALEGAAVIYATSGEDAITIIGLIQEETTIEMKVEITRKMPEMDFVVEHDNRLWGCRYGLNVDGEVVNELYACKLGDFKNWNCFMGISTDSYIVSLGSDGPFTGAITHAGYPLFFKENCLHKVYGQIPANFQVQTNTVRGVQRGSSKSLAIVNEVLYYKGRNAICAYDGSLPQEMSGALGDERYSAAVAGTVGNKLYMSMHNDGTGKQELLVYDASKGMWHKETGLQVDQFCAVGNELYAQVGNDEIVAMLGSGTPREFDVEWMAQTGVINASLPDRTYLKKLNIRMILEVGAHLSISVQYDSFGGWESLGFLTGTDLRSFTLPVRPRRCDHLRLRLEGRGRCMIFAITKSMAQGSDIV